METDPELKDYRQQLLQQKLDELQEFLASELASRLPYLRMLAQRELLLTQADIEDLKKTPFPR